ncbi:hypothetical protein [Streptomyces pini]|uniref:Uncharacterized protein n=1 Tax=Streptomyces pini TaxID=1520580 RepID=A0A1I4BVK7_9ACTN|nr:hypothetical protein [Streptomyces pini]SFK72563.1 hypothetical protein SAMN05192584_108148 [Streptomyces pini]
MSGAQWTVGGCWLGCEREGVPVLWLGPVHTAAAIAPLYGCAECIARIEARAARYVDDRYRLDTPA